MDKLEKVGPEHLGILALATVLVLVGMALWDWRWPLLGLLRSVRVNLQQRTYDKPPPMPSAATTDKPGVAATAPEARNGIAIERNDRNAELSRNDGNVVLRSRAEMIARLLKAEMLYTPDGKGGYKRVGQVALIKLATGLDPNGRADSDYARLHAELSPLLKSVLVVAPGRPEERVIEK